MLRASGRRLMWRSGRFLKVSIRDPDPLKNGRMAVREGAVEDPTSKIILIIGPGWRRSGG